MSFPSAVTVDLLAQLQLLSKRLGRRLRLVQAPPELVDLIAFMGLEEVLVVEPWRQTEQREEVLRIQKEADPGDSAV